MIGQNRFDDEVVIVTGSTRGIGAAIAEQFGSEAANVVVSGRTVSDGEAVAERVREAGGTARFVRADVSDPADIEYLVNRTVDEFGCIDVLVNNAAVQTDTSVREATTADWETVVNTNFRAYWLCVKHAADQMDRGCIVNVSSNHAEATMPDHFPYNATKSGVDGMTRAMALDLGPEIRVTGVNPGWIAVDRTVSNMSTAEREQLASIHPVGRIGDPEDVAGVVAFLASDDAAFMTGATVTVDGGRLAVMQDDTLPDYRARRSDEHRD